MKLFFSPASPFVRKVRVVIHVSGQGADVAHHPVQTSPLNTDADLAAANPMGKLPALRRPEGPALYDSRVICRYLDARAQAGLYPEARLWEVLTLEATGDAVMEAAVLMVYEGRFREESERSAAWVEAQWQKVARGVAALETLWMSHLHGPLDAGQISVGCALGYLDFRLPDRDWRAQAPQLAAWYEVFAASEAMQATAPEG